MQGQSALWDFAGVWGVTLWVTSHSWTLLGFGGHCVVGGVLSGSGAFLGIPRVMGGTIWFGEHCLGWGWSFPGHCLGSRAFVGTAWLGAHCVGQGAFPSAAPGRERGTVQGGGEPVWLPRGFRCAGAGAGAAGRGPGPRFEQESFAAGMTASTASDSISRGTGSVALRGIARLDGCSGEPQLRRTALRSGRVPHLCAVPWEAWGTREAAGGRPQRALGPLGRARGPRLSDRGLRQVPGVAGERAEAAGEHPELGTTARRPGARLGARAHLGSQASVQG